MTEKHRTLLATFEAKSKELQTILDKGEELTQEDVVSAKAIKGVLDGVKAEIDQQKDVADLRSSSDAMKSYLNDPINHPRMAETVGMTTAGETVIERSAGGTKVYSTGSGHMTDRQIKATREDAYKSAFNRYLRGDMDAVKVMQEGIDDQGGFLVPEDILTRIIMKAPTPTRVAARATVINTSRDSVVLPKVNYATDDLYTTGIRVAWTGEVPASATVHRVTEPVWGQFRVPVYTAMLSMPITNNMAEDASFDVTAWSADRFSETIDLLKDNMAINGTGVGQPSGILQNPGTAPEPTTVVSGAAATLTADGLVNLGYAIPEQYDANCAWVFNKTNTSLAIRKLKDGNGRYLWGNGLQDSGVASPIRPADLLGYPFLWSGFMPNVGASAYPIIFGDLSGYYQVIRIGFSIQVLRELYAETNQLLLLGRVRFGGDVGEDWKLKVQVVSV